MCDSVIDKNNKQSPSTCRRFSASALTETSGSTSAGDVSSVLEGGLFEEHQALWES